MPSETEYGQVIDWVIGSVAARRRMGREIDTSTLDSKPELIRALSGMTLAQARQAIAEPRPWTTVASTMKTSPGSSG